MPRKQSPLLLWRKRQDTEFFQRPMQPQAGSLDDRFLGGPDTVKQRQFLFLGTGLNRPPFVRMEGVFGDFLDPEAHVIVDKLYIHTHVKSRRERNNYPLP